MAWREARPIRWEANLHDGFAPVKRAQSEDLANLKECKVRHALVYFTRFCAITKRKSGRGDGHERGN